MPTLFRKRIIKKFVLFVLAAAALLLCSCSGDLEYFYDYGEYTPGDVQMFTYEENGDGVDGIVPLGRINAQTSIAVYNDELYFIAKNDADKSVSAGYTLYRYNPKTGNITYVCADPTCTHSTYDCPFYGIVTSCEFYIADDSVYYWQQYTYINDRPGELEPNDSTEISCFPEYNMKTGTYKNLRDTDSSSQTAGMVIYNGVCYYNDYVKDEKTDEWHDYFCSQDTKTGKITEYGVEYTPDMAFDGKLLLSAPDDSMYYLDTDTGEIHDGIGESCLYYKTDDGFIYINDRELKSCAPDGSGEKDLGVSGISYFYVTENYIYYTVQEDTVMIRVPKSGGIYGSSDKTSHQLKSVDVPTIYRMKRDGSEKTEIWRPDIEENSSFFLPEDFVVLGRYIYCDCTSYEYDEEYDVWDIVYPSHRFIRYDTETGEIYRINPEGGEK